MTAIAEPSAAIGWSVGLAFHPRAPRLATLGERDRVVRVWDLDLAALPSSALARSAIDAAARPWLDPLARARARRIVVLG